MTTNPYFNRTAMKAEQDLFESSVIEMIQVNGVDVIYIPREVFELDPIFKEPKKTIFKRSFPIEAYMPDAAQFGGEQNIMTQFGFRINQTTEFVISKKRFTELGTDRLRPKEGDLIYVGDINDPHDSFINQMFQINQVWYNNPDWQFGRHFTYRIVCESFINSYEKFQTGAAGLDQFQAVNSDEVKSGINSEVKAFSESLIKFDTGNPFRGT